MNLVLYLGQILPTETQYNARTGNKVTEGPSAGPMPLHLTLHHNVRVHASCESGTGARRYEAYITKMRQAVNSQLSSDPRGLAMFNRRA